MLDAQFSLQKNPLIPVIQHMLKKLKDFDNLNVENPYIIALTAKNITDYCTSIMHILVHYNLVPSIQTYFLNVTTHISQYIQTNPKPIQVKALIHQGNMYLDMITNHDNQCT